jgi:signal transduction histidine kinase
MPAQPQNEKKTSTTESSKSPQEERDFLDDFAHELKTPLTSIIASWSLLSEEVDSDKNSPQSRLVQNIGRSAKQMKIKIDELLDLAKMRIKNLDLKKAFRCKIVASGHY